MGCHRVATGAFCKRPRNSCLDRLWLFNIVFNAPNRQEALQHSRGGYDKFTVETISLVQLVRSTLRYGRPQLGHPKAFYFPGWTKEILTAFPHRRDPPSLYSTWWPPLDSFQHVDVLPVLGTMTCLHSFLQFSSYVHSIFYTWIYLGLNIMKVSSKTISFLRFLFIIPNVSEARELFQYILYNKTQNTWDIYLNLSVDFLNFWLLIIPD